MLVEYLVGGNIRKRRTSWPFRPGARKNARWASASACCHCFAQGPTPPMCRSLVGADTGVRLSHTREDSNRDQPIHASDRPLASCPNPPLPALGGNRPCRRGAASDDNGCHARGTEAGWRWQRSWNGLYAIAVVRSNHGWLSSQIIATSIDSQRGSHSHVLSAHSRLKVGSNPLGIENRVRVATRSATRSALPRGLNLKVWCALQDSNLRPPGS
jgi:hypothetical protein